MNLKSFDESHDNILIFDYDKDFQGHEVGAENLIYSYSREKVSLNGKWHFSTDVFDSVIRGRFFEEIIKNKHGEPIPTDFSFDEWETVNVPGQWNNARPEYALYEGTCLYVKNFSCEEIKPNESVFLRIGAANYECRVWLNKQYLGKHIGGFTPFMFDVTKQLKAENRMLIYVNNTRRSESIPSLHYDWFNYGGITRDIELIKVPKAYVKTFSLQLVPDDSYSRLEFRATISGYINSHKYCTLSIPELEIQMHVDVDEQGMAQAILAAVPKLWSPDSPKLYDVIVEYNEDQIKEKIGFRQISTQGKKILLNGKDIFLKGMCVHEESPEHLRSVTEEEIKEMLYHAKELNCNFLRLTHYPHTEKVAQLADTLGIMLWEEIPVYWALEFKNPETYANAKNQLKELVIRDINRASVIIWSIGNENPDTDERLDFMQRLAHTVKSLDQSRLVAASCLIDTDEYKIRDRLTQFIDIIGINEYYGWYIRDYSILKKILDNSVTDKPVIITETGAEAAPGKHGLASELYTEECQEAMYHNQFEMISQYDYIRGITPWILYDYASMRRLSNIQQGYNLKGIISKDRMHKKLAFYKVQKFYSQWGNK